MMTNKKIEEATRRMRLLWPTFRSDSEPFRDMGTDTSRTRIKATAHIPDEAERRHQNEVGRKIPKEAFRVHCWRREEDDDERVAYVALCILHTDRRPNKNFK